ncbi:MAG: SPOR domain-containing protein, partial [Flavobacteriaceae bacterium]|nr:SPOR domain-containing protein [Flavobacteriaceae bacterium]
MKLIKKENLTFKVLMWAIPPIVFLLLFIILMLKLTIGGAEKETKKYKNNRANITRTVVINDSVIANIEATSDTSTDSSTDSNLTESGDITTDSTSDRDSIAEIIQTPELGYLSDSGQNEWDLLNRDTSDDVLDKWRTFLIQNQNKTDYTVFSSEKESWHIEVEEGERLIIKQTKATVKNISFDRSRKKRYALQLLSLNSDDFFKATRIIKLLIQNGYYAYLHTTKNKIKKQSVSKSQYFYQVRVGFFESENETRKIGDQILDFFAEQNIFTPDFWTVLPEYHELNGEIINFGVQRNYPWVVQITKIKDKTEAINMFKKITTYSKYVILSEKVDNQNNYQYRITFGFYRNANQANKIFDKIRRKTRQKFPRKSILKFRNSITE